MISILDALMQVVEGRHRRGEGGCWLGAGQCMGVNAFTGTYMDFTHFLPDAAARQPSLPVMTSKATFAPDAPGRAPGDASSECSSFV